MENIVKLSVPDSWNEVTLDQFQEINSLSSENEERNLDIISIFLNEDPEIIRKLDPITYNRLLVLLQWSNTMPSDAVYKPIIEVNGVQYGIISKLNEMSIGEWWDIEEFIKEPIQNLHKILSILYRPLITAFNDRDRMIEIYDAKVMERQAELFKHNVMITDVYGALFFFALIKKQYLKIMQEYLEVETQEMTKTLDQMKQKKNESKD